MSSFSSKQISFDIDVGNEAEKETEKPGTDAALTLIASLLD